MEPTHFDKLFIDGIKTFEVFCSYRCEFGEEREKIILAGEVIKVINPRIGSKTAVVELINRDKIYTIRKSNIYLEPINIKENPMDSVYEQLVAEQKHCEEKSASLKGDIERLKKSFSEDELKTLSNSELKIAIAFLRFSSTELSLKEKIKAVKILSLVVNILGLMWFRQVSIVRKASRVITLIIKNINAKDNGNKVIGRIAPVVREQASCSYALAA